MISMPASVNTLLPNSFFIGIDENMVSCVNNGDLSIERPQPMAVEENGQPAFRKHVTKEQLSLR